jgi:phenylalanyl-tRNA synthetase beta chain
VQIDLEVTSNRPDCLGHIGIAREASVLWQPDCRADRPRRPQRELPTVTELTSVAIECPNCARATRPA